MREIMKILIGLVISLTWLSGVLSSNQLVQSDPAVIKPGDSHTLTCQASGGFTFGSSWMHWIRQNSDGKLQWLCYITSGGGTGYHDDVKGRFTATRDNTNNKLTLKMDNMKIEDTAVYYCARTGAAIYAMDIWGPGSLLTVSSASPAAPSLFPLISCDPSQSTSIGCLAMNYLPDSIEFSWADNQNASYSNGFKKFNSVLKSDGTYAASTQVTVNPADWMSRGSFYCTAKHQAVSKTLELPYPNAVGRKPLVTIHPPIYDDVELNGNATIACVISGFYPKNIEVSWKKSNHELPLNAITEEPVSDGNGSFTMTSYIIVSKKDWNTDVIFSSIVKHSPSDFLEIKNVSKSTVCDTQVTPGEIKVTVVPPSFETIYMKNTAPLTCIISNMENKDGLEVSWHSNTEKINTKIEDPEYDTSLRRYRAKAIASVCPEDWNTKTFECRVSHPELPRVEVVSLRKPNGQDARAPIVLLYPPHPDELAKKESVTLLSLVKSFTPTDIFVKWMDSDIKEQANVVTTGPIEEITSSSKKTYFLVSTLTISVEEWNKGNKYTCIVGHESLPLHTTQRTIDKTAGKPTNVNVSLVMSDSC